MGWPQSVALKPEMELARLIERHRLHSGFLWSIGMALVVAWFASEGAALYLVYALSLYLLAALPGGILAGQAGKAAA